MGATASAAAMRRPPTQSWPSRSPARSWPSRSPAFSSAGEPRGPAPELEPGRQLVAALLVGLDRRQHLGLVNRAGGAGVLDVQGQGLVGNRDEAEACGDVVLADRK